MTDPIADMLTRIRNAQMVKKSEVVMPYSKLKLNLLKLLAKEGWIDNVEKIEAVPSKSKKQAVSDNANRFATLSIRLKYNSEREPRISNLKRISKPGRRVYVNKEQIPIVLNHKGISIISTSQGLLTGQQAKDKNVGGEIICEIY